MPLHRQTCFEELGYAVGSLPVSEQAALETIALPIFPELTVAEQETVVRRIAEFLLPAEGKMPHPHLEPGNLTTGNGTPARV